MGSLAIRLLPGCLPVFRNFSISFLCSRWVGRFPLDRPPRCSIASLSNFVMLGTKGCLLWCVGSWARGSARVHEHISQLLQDPAKYPGSFNSVVGLCCDQSILL